MPDYSTNSPLLTALQRYKEKYFAEVRAAAEDEANIKTAEVLGTEDCDANSDAQGQTVATAD